jgi:hypothetical protein
MTMINIAAQRLYNQHLEGEKFQTPAEVVGWLGAVQAQEYGLAKWALGLRMGNATDEVLERAFNDGAILRTHVMRPTWHFVTPEDIRWILELTAPRVHAVNAYMYRQLELDAELLVRCSDAIVKVLEGEQHLTRAELGSVLTEIGIDTTNGMRLGYIVHHAELERIVCSGPRQGKQHTYALIDERAPQSRKLARDEALAELTRRYFTSHGPATVKDFAWWSGLTVADVKVGLSMLGSQLVSEEIDGQTFWYSPSMSAIQQAPITGHLLPVYDEYGIAYKYHSASLDSMYAEQMKSGFFTSAFVLGGQYIGMWRRTFNKGAIHIEVAPFRPFTAAEQEAFAEAAQRFGDFMNMPVVLV